MRTIIHSQTVTNTYGQTFELAIEDRGKGARPYRVGAVDQATGEVVGVTVKTLEKAEQELASAVAKAALDDPFLNRPVAAEFVIA